MWRRTTALVLRPFSCSRIPALHFPPARALGNSFQSSLQTGEPTDADPFRTARWVTRRLCNSVRMPPKSKNNRRRKEATSLVASSARALLRNGAAGAQTAIDLEKLALTDTAMAVAQALVSQNGAKAATLSLRAASRVSGGARSGLGQLPGGCSWFCAARGRPSLSHTHTHTHGCARRRYGKRV